MHGLQRLDRGRAHHNLLLLEQPAADQHDLGPGVSRERRGNRRRVGHDGAGVGVWETAGELQSRRPPVQHDHPRAFEQRQGRLGQRRLLLVPDLESLGEGDRRRPRDERAAVDTTEQPLLGEVTQVASNRVLGHAEARDQLRGDDPSIAREAGKNHLFAFGGEHLASYSSFMLVSA